MMCLWGQEQTRQLGGLVVQMEDGSLDQGGGDGGGDGQILDIC